MTRPLERDRSIHVARLRSKKSLSTGRDRMAWYAYCITEQQAFQGENRARRPFIIEQVRGIGDRQVMGYPSGELAVMVSEYKRANDLDQKAILEHVKVVAECFRSATNSNTTVLPFRFGTIFDTDDALRRAVRSNRKAF